MPYFKQDVVNVYITVDEFYDELELIDKEELIGLLKKEFDIIQYKTLYKPSIPEIEFEEALNKLHQKWNRLSKEDEQIIINIAKKF